MSAFMTKLSIANLLALPVLREGERRLALQAGCLRATVAIRWTKFTETSIPVHSSAPPTIFLSLTAI